MSYLQEKYVKEVLPMLQKELGRKNINALPKLKKVSISVGIGSMVTGGMKDYSHIENSISALDSQWVSTLPFVVSLCTTSLLDS